jgi:hypothetical protein
MENYWEYLRLLFIFDRLCGLVLRVPGYRSGGPWFDSQALQKSSGSGTGPTEPRDYNWEATWKK